MNETNQTNQSANPSISDLLTDVIQPAPNSCLEKILPAAGVALLAIGAVALIANAISCEDVSDNPLIVH